MFGRIRRPIIEDYWGILYYGARGTCKSIHQALHVHGLLHWLNKYYKRRPELHRAIVISNQKFSEEWEKLWLGRDLFYWEKLDDLKYCPRPDCWLGPDKHAIHGAYVVFDDISTILPADSWASTPIWFRKMLAQARHNGVHTLANCQDPFAIDINYRRYVDVAYKFSTVFTNRDPDETKSPIRFVFGIYHTRRIDADMLYKYGDLPEQMIRIRLIEEDERNEELERIGKAYAIVYDDNWAGKFHYFTRRNTQIYDTTQNVKAKEVLGYRCKEVRCIDPAHVHPWDREGDYMGLDELKKLPNFCKYVKKVYEEVI